MIDTSDWEIAIGEPIEIVEGIRQGLVAGKIESLRVPETIQEEEHALSALNIASTSLHFEKTRNHFQEALRAIVGHIFKKFQLKPDNGVDFGSGATGFMVEDLLDGLIDKFSWAQVEINKNAVDENRRRHPESTIITGSYHRTSDLGLRNQINTASFLSSLDATHFITHAINEIRQTLVKGGYLFHVQDVRPGIGVGPRELKRLGYEQPYRAECIPGSHPNPLLYIIENDWRSVIDLFRTNLGAAIKSVLGMELIFNEWVTASRKSKLSLPGEVYYSNMRLTSPEQPIHQASAVVTVAKKVR